MKCAMAPRKDVQIVGIAAADHTGERHTRRQAAFYNVIVTRAKPRVAERQFAELA